MAAICESSAAIIVASQAPWLLPTMPIRPGVAGVMSVPASEASSLENLTSSNPIGTGRPWRTGLPRSTIVTLDRPGSGEKSISSGEGMLALLSMKCSRSVSPADTAPCERFTP